MNGRPFDIDEIEAKLESCWGLPLHFYYDPAIHDVDLRAIFRRNWQYFGPLENLSEPGDVMVGFAGDVPVVATRDAGGQLRAFVNVCRHRGYRVAGKNAKKCERLVCRYHAWSYWLDGKLAHAPGSGDEADFPKDELGLLPVSIDQWGAAIFVNADPNAKPFLDFYPDMAAEAKTVGMELNPARYRFFRACTHEVPSNWKLWYDNFVECYHCDNIHRGSFSAAYEANIDSIYTRYCGRFMSSRFPPREGRSKTMLRANNYRSFNIFPGLLILQQDDLMIASQMRPIGAECVEQSIHYFIEEGADEARVEAWIELWEQTFTEDGEATAIQQSGLRTGVPERNRLLPAREQPVLFFNGLTCQAYRAYLEEQYPRALNAAE